VSLFRHPKEKENPMFRDYFDQDWELERDRERERGGEHEAARYRRHSERDEDVRGPSEWNRIRERDHERVKAERPWRWQNQGVQPGMGTFGGTNYGGVVGTSAYGGGAEPYSITNPDANAWLTEKKGRHYGVGPKGYKRSDARVTEDVCERLTYHPSIDASGIEVKVVDGEVTLSGSVPDRTTKFLAEEVAEHVPGVKDVQNRIRVSRRPSLDEMDERGAA
jgi:osmotically-inducible protein OsmY